MPAKGQTRTVQKMQEDIAKAKSKRSKAVEKTVNNSTPFTTPEVVNDKAIHSQPENPPFTTSEVVSFTTSKVVPTRKEHIREDIKVKNSLNNLEVQDFDLLIDSGLKPEQVEAYANELLPLFAAEGLTPSSRVLADSIRQLHRDAGR